MNRDEEKIRLDKKSKQLLIGGLIAFGVATILIIFMPIIITKYSIIPLGVEKPNEIGDTLGGIMGPVVALIGVLLTFLAFWAQYVANQEQRNQFQHSLIKQDDDKKEQQFESQFFEMLRLHKENVDELKVVSLTDNVEVQRRQVFEVMANEFSTMLSYVTFADFDLNADNYLSTYNVFFWGYASEAQNLSESAQQILRLEGVTTNTPMINFTNHRGFSSSLGHYFRHLFMMVKFVVESKIINEYDAKMRYLKILRAQLSNHEQIMLFYNWLAKSYGGSWEEENGNHYFTEYKMIHNLWVGELLKDKFFANEVNSLIDNYNKNPKATPLFEFQGSDFNARWEI